MLRAEANGSVKIYSASGGSGDVINVTVENFVPLSISAVFTESDIQNVTTAEQGPETTTLASNADVLGPLVADVDGDGSEDISYVPTGNTDTVHIVNPDGSDETELSSNDAKGSPSLLGVGRWNDTRTSVYFASGDKTTIYRTNSTQGDVKVVEPSKMVSAVAGPADIDGDDTNELVYADDSQALRYFEPGAGPGSATGTKISLTNGIGSSSGIGLGRPADFDGDGTARIPLVDGSNRLILVNSTGSETVFSSNATKAPVAAVDWDDDGELEVMYITTNENLKYVDDVDGSQTVEDTGISGPKAKTGVT
jgi:hypothetical protein